MRIAAGVLLIIAAIFNVIAGATHGIIGAAGEMVGEAVEESGALKAVTDEVAKEDTKAAAEVSKTAANLTEGATGVKYFGFFLLAMFVVQIIGAVMLFTGKGKLFIFIVAGLSILAEIGGIVILSFGLSNIPGLVAGVLAFLGAMKIGEAAAAPPAAPEAPAA